MEVIANKYDIWTQKLKLLTANMANLAKSDNQTKNKISYETRMLIR